MRFTDHSSQENFTMSARMIKVFLVYLLLLNLKSLENKEWASLVPAAAVTLALQVEIKIIGSKTSVVFLITFLINLMSSTLRIQGKVAK